MSRSNLITLPQEILERVARVGDYHLSTKLTPQEWLDHPQVADPLAQPHPFRTFEMLPATSLPPALPGPKVPTLALMESGFEALPDRGLEPPSQDLKTLATWLHFADGIASKRRTVTAMQYTRTCASDGDCFPCELYIAAFAIDGLEPGFYHYAPREFALRKLRDAPETLARLTRGRPDLIFLRNIPLVMLVSTIYCRSTWKFGKRGYRHALHDTGYLVQNLVTVATAMAAQTLTRLMLNDAATRELIGVPADEEFAQAEAVQAMIAWADPASHPLESAAAVSPSPGTPGQSHVGTQPGDGGKKDASKPTESRAPADPRQPMPPIPRDPLTPEVVDYVSILATHQDCVAPGVAVREVRPPLTDLTPLSPNHPSMEAPIPLERDVPPGEPLRKVLLTRQASTAFAPRPISRPQFMQINRLAFRGGTFYPLHPDGPHVALVRPFWLIFDVPQMEPGVWYYHPPTDRWSIIRHGAFRRESVHLALDQPLFGTNCAACAFLTASLQYLMSVVGPDIYRLAHLESGIVTNRVALASEGLNLGWAETGSCFDDEARQFLGLGMTGWEILNVIAVGARQV
jgi:SagB-type dehydrogenase family enzyme